MVILNQTSTLGILILFNHIISYCNSGKAQFVSQSYLIRLLTLLMEIWVQAYIGIHTPQDANDAEQARQRLVFDEFFYLQVFLD